MVDDTLRELVEVLDSVSIGEAVVFGASGFLVLFVVVAVHELAHAAVALLRTDGLVVAHVGREPGLFRGRVGRLAFSFDLRPAEEGDAGRASVVADLGRGEQIAFALAGPVANLVLAAVLVPMLDSVSGVARFVVAGTIVLSSLTTLWNLVSPDPGSDGRRALAAYRGDAPSSRRRADGDLANAAGRWMALYANGRDRRFSKQRAFLFGVAPYELGFDPRTSNGEAREYWNLARAGWCWREVRPAPDVVSGPAREAWRAQSLEGRAGLELAGAAAVDLARQEAPAGVEDAFHMTTELRRAADDAQSRFAFRYGVALHDVERVMAEHGQLYW